MTLAVILLTLGAAQESFALSEHLRKGQDAWGVTIGGTAARRTSGFGLVGARSYRGLIDLQIGVLQTNPGGAFGSVGGEKAISLALEFDALLLRQAEHGARFSLQFSLEYQRDYWHTDSLSDPRSRSFAAGLRLMKRSDLSGGAYGLPYVQLQWANRTTALAFATQAGVDDQDNSFVLTLGANMGVVLGTPNRWQKRSSAAVIIDPHICIDNHGLGAGITAGFAIPK